jgi:ABC-2 type transport system ATP-binding protein
VTAAALRSVTKRFGAVLGPNGAGKTTALAILLGLRRPDRGRAQLFGDDPRLPSARAAIGVTPQECGFPPTLRVVEILDLVRAHFPCPAARDDLLDRFRLAGVARRQAGGLSGGEQRRLALALAFAGRPRALFLDEPTSGLDVDARRAVWREIELYASGGGTVLVTTHQLDEAEALATRIVLLSGGRVAAQGDVAELVACTGTARLEEAFLTLTGGLG